MLSWDGIDLVLALWTPLLVVWSVMGAWVILSPWKAPRLGGPRTPAAIHSPTTLHAMLDVADERAVAFLATLTGTPRDPAGLERNCHALEITTLVALLMVRDWAVRLDRRRLGPRAAPVVEAIRSRTSEALLTLLVSSSPPCALHHRHVHTRRLREQLAELAAELRTFQHALRPWGQDPYR